MRLKIREICWLLLGILAVACNGFDTDLDFVPESREAILLVEEENKRKLLRWTPTGWSDFFPEIAPSALDGGPNEVFFSDASRQKLYRYRPRSGETTPFEIGRLFPHHISVGAEFVLLADTNQRQLAFWHRGRETVEATLALVERPGIMHYRSEKFFVTLDDSLVGVYREQAFARLATVALPGPVRSFQDDRFDLIRIALASEPARGCILSYNTHALTGECVPLNALSVHYSPYLRSRYEGEWLRDMAVFETVRLINGDSLINGALTAYSSQRRAVLPYTFSPIQADAKIDFFSGRVFFRRNDSLVVGLLPATIERAIPFEGMLLEAWFFAEPPNI